MGAGLSQELLDASEPSDVAKVLLDGWPAPSSSTSPTWR